VLSRKKSSRIRQSVQARRAAISSVRPCLEALEVRALLSVNPVIGNVFYIEMENHNLAQPASVTSPAQLLNNPAAPYLNSLMTPGNPNAAQTSYASNYYNALYNNPSVSIHPSEPNYVWQEAGLTGPLNDADPYPNNIVNAPNLSALLQNAGVSWKSYQEDIDLLPTSGTVNQPAANSLTSTVAPQSQWTVPLKSFSGTSPAYTNAYNGAHQYNFAAKHDGSLFFTATNGSTTTPNFDPSNSEAKYYAPLQQFQTDLNNNTLAQYNLITPDQYNDMHSSLNTDFTYNGVTYPHNTDQESIALGDNFLSQIVPQIMSSQAYKNNGVIVIWFDETEAGNTTSFTIPEIVISPLAKGNAYNSTLPYTHSSDLKSMQELFGVQAPGGGFLGDANTPGTNDLSDFFVPGVFTPSSLSGTVVKNSGKDHQVQAGLTVTLTGINDAGQNVTFTTTTNNDGYYSFDGLLPGTYDVSIQGARKHAGISSIKLGVGQTLTHQNFSLLGPNSNQ
jgi:phosphatidylinositol-3-phosphatase